MEGKKNKNKKKQKINTYKIRKESRGEKEFKSQSGVSLKLFSYKNLSIYFCAV